MHTFQAKGIPVFRFSREPDARGWIVPPECHVTFAAKVPVYFGPTDLEHHMGDAVIRRVGDFLCADLELRSKIKDPLKAIRAMRLQYPAIAFTVVDAIAESIFRISIPYLFLTPDGNEDKSIDALGYSVGYLT